MSASDQPFRPSAGRPKCRGCTRCRAAADDVERPRWFGFTWSHHCWNAHCCCPFHHGGCSARSRVLLLLTLALVALSLLPPLLPLPPLCSRSRCSCCCSSPTHLQPRCSSRVILVRLALVCSCAAAATRAGSALPLLQHWHRHDLCVLLYVDVVSCREGAAELAAVMQERAQLLFASPREGG